MQSMQWNLSSTALLISLIFGSMAFQVHGAGPQLLQRKGIMDPQYNLPAYFLMAPEGWKVGGTISYSPAPTLAKTVIIQLDNAARTRGFSILLGESMYTYGWGPIWQMYLNSPGFNGTYNGMQVMVPLSAAEYAQQVLLPFLQQQQPDLVFYDFRTDQAAIKAAEQRDAQSPHVIAILQTGGRMEYDAILFKFRHSEKGHSLEGQSALKISRAISNQGNGNMSVIWGMESLLNLYAEKGALDAAGPQLIGLLRTIKMNPEWYVRMQNQRYRLWNKAMTAQAEVSDVVTRNIADRSGGGSRDSFSEYIRGSETYKNPHTGETIELEGGHEQVWFNRNGDIMYSDDVNYSPNTDPRFNNQSWSEGRQGR